MRRPRTPDSHDSRSNALSLSKGHSVHGHGHKSTGVREASNGGTPQVGVSRRVFGSFLAWLQDRKGDVFVGSLRTGEIPGTGHVERILFNDKMQELRRESLLRDMSDLEKMVRSALESDRRLVVAGFRPGEVVGPT